MSQISNIFNYIFYEILKSSKKLKAVLKFKYKVKMFFLS